MEIFVITFKAVGLLAGIGVVGFWILAKKIVARDIIKVLTPLVIDVGLPCMIFTNILLHFSPNKMKQWWTLPLWWSGMAVLFTVMALLFGHVVHKQFFGESRIALVFPNGIFFPLALIPGIFGQGHPLLVKLFIFTLLFPIFVFNAYTLFFRIPFKKGEWSKVFNPIFISTVIAICLKLSGFDTMVPETVLKITESIGRISLPLIMMVIGGNIFIDFQEKGTIYAFPVLKFVFFKNIVFPAVTLLCLVLINPSPTVAILIFMQSMMPPLSAVPILTHRVNGNTTLVNQFMVGSFSTALITIPLGMMAFSHFFNLF